MEELDNPSGNAGDLSALVLFVENHPEDHEARWRLAKKLYMAWEYRRALDHLLVLKRDWTPKLNVTRYTAATYYRLGRYQEAIAELNEATETWPEDIGVREQLARVYEVAGQPERALEEWEVVQALDPNASTAGRAIQRLRLGGAPGIEEGPTFSSDSAIDLGAKMACPHCGAHNNVEFDRCWQCHGALAKPGTPTPAIAPRAHDEPPQPWLWTLIVGLFTVMLVSAGLYLWLGQVRVLAAPVDSTANALVGSSLLMARPVFGGALTLAWPVVLLIALRVLRSPKVPAIKVVTTGLCLGALCFILTWLPFELLFLLPIIAVTLSLAFIGGGFEVGWARSLGVWLIQAVVMTGIGAGAIVGALGMEPIRQYPSIARHLTLLKTSDFARYRLPSASIPYQFAITWESSGSAWLDTRARQVYFELHAVSPTGAGVLAKLTKGAEVIHSGIVEGDPYLFPVAIQPGQEYVLSVRGPEGTPVSGSIHGYLRARLRTFGVSPQDRIEAPPAGS